MGFTLDTMNGCRPSRINIVDHENKTIKANTTVFNHRSTGRAATDRHALMQAISPAISLNNARPIIEMTTFTVWVRKSHHTSRRDI